MKLKAIIHKHQITVFFILTFILSWYPWYAGKGPEVFTLGTSLAAFIIVFAAQGKKGVVDLLRPFGRVRRNARFWAIAALGPAFFFLIGLGLHLLRGGGVPPFTMIKQEMGLIPLYLVLVVLLPLNGPVGEEFGWRGFALPKLQLRFNPLTASIIIGIAWGVWHLPTFFKPLGVTGALAAYWGVGLFLPIYIVGTIANSIFMTWLYNKSRSSALLAGIIWHAAIDFWAPILLSDSSLTAAREGTHLPTIAPDLYLTVIIVLGAGAAVLTIVTRGRLAYSPITDPVAEKV
jgi:uncharacterized protein